MEKTTYTYQQVYDACLKYFKGNELAATAVATKYVLQDNEGHFLELDPEDYIYNRIAPEFARIEASYPNPISVDDIRGALKGFKYILCQGSPTFGIGNKYQVVSLGNCFVVGQPADSYSGIMRKDEELAQIMKRRGGVGMDLSTLRPSGAPVKNSARSSDGIGVFLRRYSNTTKEVAQGGRRGALMLGLHCLHPDIETFINIKRDDSQVTGANLSVKWTNEFLKAVENDTDIKLRFPVDADPKDASKVRNVKARAIWNQFIQAAWGSGEPGCIYWDRVIKQSISDCYASDGFASIISNPCVTGDTLIAVADGRVSVSIKQLAEDGKDVRVYCKNEEGITVVRTMRRPRKTGTKLPVFRVTMDDGSSVRCTGNHRFMTKNGMVEAKDLKQGTSLVLMSKWKTNHGEILGQQKNGSNYWMINDGINNVFEHRFFVKDLLSEFKRPVVHHKDFNGSNNDPSNLVVLEKEQHDGLHDISGDKNPMRKWFNSINEEQKDVYRERMSKACTGEKNGNSSPVTNEEVLNAMVELIKHEEKPLSLIRWQTHAKKIGMPQIFTSWRGNIRDTISKANDICGFDTVGMSTSAAIKMTACRKLTDLPLLVKEGTVCVKKKCEVCGGEFIIPFGRREQAHCSLACSSSANIGKKNPKGTAYLKSLRDKKKVEARKLFTERVITSGTIPGRTDMEVILANHGMTDLRSCGHYSYKSFLKEMTSGLGVEINTKAFSDEYMKMKANELILAGLQHNHKVVSVVQEGTDDVYNGTVDEFHNYGIVLNETTTKSGKTMLPIVFTANCGEIFLQDGGACLLQVINLTGFVENQFKKEAEVNWGLFDKYVRIGVRMMDDLVDLELEKIETIIAKIKSDPEAETVKSTELGLWLRVKDNYIRGRRVGLGITGLADMLAMLGYKYDSEQSLVFAEKLFSTLQATVYDENAELAKERGAFPVWSWEKEKDSPYIMQLPQSVQDKIKKYGRRNIACLTISPSGTTSMLSETSSGIEPVIQLSYRRNKKMTPEEEAAGAKPDYVDKDGIKWVGFDVIHQPLAIWTKATGKTDFKESPYWGCDINGADWRFRVRLQALAQKYIDQSISSTVNLPNSATVEDVHSVYMLAWKEGCKGITLFRDGCRRGVIQSQKTTVEAVSPKREPILQCDIHYSNIRNKLTEKTEQWIFLVGIQKGMPYEVFGGKKTLIDLPKRYTQGWILKNGKNDKGVSTYNLILGSLDEDNPDRMVIQDIAQVFTPEPGSFTRLISLSLRNRVPLRFICEQLLKDSDASMFTFEKGLARVLRKYIKDGEKTGDMCPKCGNSTLEYRSGCVYCVTPNCGWSKCD